VSARPKLLFVSPRFLFPTDEGGKIRTASILRAMRGGMFEITLASPAPPNHAAFAAELEGVCDRFVPWPAPPRARIRRVMALADKLPVGVALDRHAAGRGVVAALLAQEPDVLLADFPHAAVLLPEDALGPASVLFTHNVETEIFERHARVATGARRLVWRQQARKMGTFERDACRRFDTVIAVSARDARALAERFGLSRVETIDTGVDLDFFAYSPPAPKVPPDGGTIVFTGVMDSPANIDGVDFLMNEAWPAIVRARPAARLVVAGRNPDPALVARARARGVAFTFTGFVDDIRPHIAAADVSVIPLRVGSGTRIKAFESMASGRPVVATGIGIEGLDTTPGEHFLQADTGPDIAAAVLRLLDDADLRARLAASARARLEERFSWSHVARQFERICADAHARHTPQPSILEHETGARQPATQTTV
jgi:glycosyltransferase involved in cell wall biosynthesis